MEWHRRKYADASLRLIGLALLALAAVIGRRLFAAADPQAIIKPMAYLLGLLFFAGASSGTALLALGRHLFDQVELSARWTIHSQPRANRSAGHPPPRDLQ